MAQSPLDLKKPDVMYAAPIRPEALRMAPTSRRRWTALDEGYAVPNAVAFTRKVGGGGVLLRSPASQLTTRSKRLVASRRACDGVAPYVPPG